MPVSLTLRLNSYSAAFADNPSAEVSRILRSMADSVDTGAEGPFHLRDINGNAVGSAFLEVWPDTKPDED